MVVFNWKAFIESLHYFVVFIILGKFWITKLSISHFFILYNNILKNPIISPDSIIPIVPEK